MLVIDLYALQTVNFLHLVNQVFCQFLDTQHTQNVMRIGGTVHQGFACTYMIPFVNADMLPFRDQILFWFTKFWCNDNLAFSFGVFTV